MSGLQKASLGLISLLAVLGMYVALFRYQDISEWVFLRSYEPAETIVNLADEAGMSEKGRREFYLSDPKLVSKDEFRSFCEFAEKSIVLGCYDGRGIYILDVEDKQLEDVEIVTAAHEMLHAVYQDLSEAEKRRIDRLTDQAIQEVDNERVIELVAEYKKDDPNVVENELHSILATEISELPEDLEEHYSQFFDDRSKVVSTAESYAKVFTDLEDQLEAYDQQLNELSTEIKSLEENLGEMQIELENKQSDLDSFLAADNISAYNALVPEFNALVRDYNQSVEQLKADLEKYNEIVALRNDIAVQSNQLAEELTTEIEPIQAN